MLLGGERRLARVWQKKADNQPLPDFFADLKTPPAPSASDGPCWEANQKPDESFNEGAAFIQQRKDFDSLAQDVFGDDSKEGSEHSGQVIFVGGFPVDPPNLGLDIVNPHHEANG